MTCECITNYYEAGTPNCTQCHSSCQTCDNVSNTSCLSCFDN